MLSVEDALSAIAGNAALTGVEKKPVGESLGRVLASDIKSPINQPPFRASAMDGYAVRFDDASPGARLAIIGEAAAGTPFQRPVRQDEAVRIFTGGAVPYGADHVVIQEEADAHGGELVIRVAQERCANIREAGVDFVKGALLKKKGEKLDAVDLGFIAAANIGAVETFRKPVVAYFDNGDELREPGGALGPGQIVGSNRFAFEGLIAGWGGAPKYLGRAADSPDSILEKFEAARGADILAPIGGASVGDHDYVRGAFAKAGGVLIFSKIAVRPGKPTWFGKVGDTRVLGLPGNPASAIVCAILFLRRLIEVTSGATREVGPHRAALKSPLKPNGPRETYLRGRMTIEAGARVVVAPCANQDSSLYSPLVRGNCLIRRAANAPPVLEGDICDCILYGSIGAGDA